MKEKTLTILLICIIVIEVGILLFTNITKVGWESDYRYNIYVSETGKNQFYEAGSKIILRGINKYLEKYGIKENITEEFVGMKEFNSEYFDVKVIGYLKNETKK